MKTMHTIIRLMFIVSASLVFAATAFAQHSAPNVPETLTKKEARQLELSRKTFTGDLDQMLERRLIRVQIPFSRTLYFTDRGREMGFAAETVRDFEQWINKKYRKQLGKRPLTVVIIPTTREKLLPDLTQGLCEIAVGNLTITEERLKGVDFVSAAGVSDMVANVKELVITGPKSPAIASIDDLAGKTVHVRKSSSYYESLNKLNERFAKEGKPAVKLVLVPDALEDEDMMEMVNAGLLEAIVVSDYMAKMWAPVLPKMKINEQAAVREDAKIGWAIQKGNPKLAAEIDDFFKKHMKKQGVFAYRLKKYMSRIKKITDATGTSEWKRFQELLAYFDKYGEKYNFDPIMLAAQGYQESQLNQSAKSYVGAVGVMQIMPATGKGLKVGSIKVTENNIHAGTKYMDQLMTKYFSDADFKGNNRTLFAFASYNCGPGNVSKLRKLAAKRGLDPNEWFDNVEIVTAEKIGMETTTYVRNIFKYYVAYKLQLDAKEAAKKAREQMTPATPTKN